MQSLWVTTIGHRPPHVYPPVYLTSHMYSFSQAFPLRFCILQVIKNWRLERPGNEAIVSALELAHICKSARTGLTGRCPLENKCKSKGQPLCTLIRALTVHIASYIASLASLTLYLQEGSAYLVSHSQRLIKESGYVRLRHTRLLEATTTVPVWG